MSAQSMVIIGTAMGAFIGGNIPNFIFGANLNSFYTLSGIILGGAIGFWVAFLLSREV